MWKGEIEMTSITNLELIIGILAILVFVFILITFFTLQTNKELKKQVEKLRKDNRELIRRLEIISRSKVID